MRARSFAICGTPTCSWLASERVGQQGSFDVPRLVAIGARDPCLQHFGGRCDTGAQGEVQIEQNRPQGEEFTKQDQHVRIGRGGLQQNGARPLADGLLACARGKLQVFVLGDFRADGRSSPARPSVGQGPFAPIGDRAARNLFGMSRCLAGAIRPVRIKAERPTLAEHLQQSTGLP
jgi:hypothetical protein